MKFTGFFLLVVFGFWGCGHPGGSSGDWPNYGGNKENNRYSSLTQINVGNVKDLKVAWTYNSGSGAA
ncbi:hypothetical protein ACQ86N_27565 [Puia sp. P3]|uniref:hypothetical protein n=1 Tax=Puia sp. P3 TaxID=3423952 RepID=UPI003D663D13